MDNKNRKEVLAKALEGVDREHDMIFEILDKIKYSFNNDLSAGLKKSLIKELYLFLEFHFTSEENLLVMFDSQDGGSHKKEHDNLRHKLAEIIGSLDIDDFDYQELEQFVAEWLKSHTKHSDTKLTEFIKIQFEA
jgi:hemerythrin-like metal-binding protein